MCRLTACARNAASGRSAPAGRSRLGHGTRPRAARRVRRRADPALPVASAGIPVQLAPEPRSGHGDEPLKAAHTLSTHLAGKRAMRPLDVFETSSVSFNSTNLVESDFPQLETKSRCVTRWWTNDQKLYLRETVPQTLERHLAGREATLASPCSNTTSSINSRLPPPLPRARLRWGTVRISTTPRAGRYQRF